MIFIYYLRHPISMIILTCCILFTACKNTPFMDDLDKAENLLPDYPDSVLEIIKDIPLDKLNDLERAQYVFVKTRAFAKTKQSIPWPEEIHNAAIFYVENSHSFDGNKGGAYFYFSGLALYWNKMIPEAIIDWITCAEILEKEKPCRRLYSTYENLYQAYSEQMMTDECVLYAKKALMTARQINDSTRILNSLNYLAAQLTERMPFDTVHLLIDEAINIAKQKKDSIMLACSYERKMSLFDFHNKYQEASHAGDSAIAYSNGKAKYILNTYARIKYHLGEVDSAVAYFLNSYPDVSWASKYWTSRFLFEISKLPGYERLVSFGDSAIYYNSKFDHEELSQVIEKKTNLYTAEKAKKTQQKKIRNTLFGSIEVFILLIVVFAWKTKTATQLAKLPLSLFHKRSSIIPKTEKSLANSKKQKESLEEHYKLFTSTDIYRYLQLQNPKATINNKETIINSVLSSFYDPVKPLFEESDFSHEDIFLCLMFYMKIRSRNIANILGVSDDAIRKRKSRLRQKLQDKKISLFDK